MKVIIIFLLSLWVVDGVKNDFSTIDKLRNDLLELKDVSIEKKFQERSDSDVYDKILKLYDSYGNKIDNEMPNTGRGHLSSLSSLWLWSRAQNDMRIINGLYDSFRQKLHDNIQKKQPFNLQQWIIFSDVILSDPNVAVPNALKRISDLIIKDTLFIHAFKVA